VKEKTKSITKGRKEGISLEVITKLSRGSLKLRSRYKFTRYGVLEKVERARQGEARTEHRAARPKPT
jgi:hypothetical protein